MWPLGRAAGREKRHCTNAHNSVTHQTDGSTSSLTGVCKDPNALGRGVHTVGDTALDLKALLWSLEGQRTMQESVAAKRESTRTAGSCPLVSGWVLCGQQVTGHDIRIVSFFNEMLLFMYVFCK